MFSKNKIIKTLSLTGVVYGFLGWFYIMLVALVHPETLTIQLSNLTPWIREDAFGILCFIISAICFIVWNLHKDIKDRN